MKTSNSLSNEALLEQFDLSSDCMTVVEILPSAEKGLVRLGFAQKWTSPLSRPRTAAESIFGSKTSGIIRYWRSVSKAEWKGFEPGTTIEDMVLRVVDTIRKPLNVLSPRLTREGTVLVDAHGNPIYREIVPCLVGTDSLLDFVIEAFDSGEVWEQKESEVAGV